MRADVNVSVRKPGEGFRTRCEIKNVNSVRFVMHAVEAEAMRQIEVWESGGEVVQETRLYDPSKGETRSMRSKEDAHDYRYFPEPDLLPLILEQEFVDRLKAGLPELPDEKRARFCEQYGIPFYDAGVLVADQATADFYETVAKGRDGKLTANWMTGDFFAAMNRTGKTHREPARLGGGSRRAARPDHRQDHQRPHRQGCVRGDGGNRQRRPPPSSRRKACAR